ncbi:carbohydrate kinase [uncultured Roseobacter sp.]|uniref:carbohydrate kinase family protein n=1 Tax=uncultured Roseobacter sp. TaxID=114847 RepID=UPI00261D809A|nr:carbohydrate kinase [uncultured Roseobacter sp.]
MILCCGEALIDMIPTPVTTGGTGFVPHAGGAVFNTAIALGRLGVGTGFLTGMSRDLFGEQLREALEHSGVDARFAVLSDLPTTLAFVRLTDGHATYTFYDENTAGRSLFPDQLPDLPDSIETLYFGGISLISEPCADFYAGLALRDADSRAIVMDPNIRPGFIRDEARYRARLDLMIARTDILKVSDEDLEWILPGPGPLAEKAQAILAKGPGVVIVTRGGDGASAYLADGTAVEAPAQRVEVVDTVGAGDTFNAGVLEALSAGGYLKKSRISDISAAQMEKALARGAAVAAVTVSRAGANPPWARELSGLDLA